MTGAGSSDPDGSIAGYNWAKTAGSAVVINGANTSTPSFIAPDTEGTLIFTLTVRDNFGATASDQVTITATKSGR